MIIWNAELYHSWGNSPKMKRLEKAYNAWYYKNHKEKWKDNVNSKESSGHKFNDYELGTRKKVKSSTNASNKTTGTAPSFSRSTGNASSSSSEKSSGRNSKKTSSGKGRSSGSGKGKKGGSGKGKKKSTKKGRVSKKVTKKKQPIDSYSYNYIYENGKLIKIDKKKSTVTTPSSKPKKSRRKRLKKTLNKKKSSITKKQVAKGKAKFNNRSK